MCPEQLFYSQSAEAVCPRLPLHLLPSFGVVNCLCRLANRSGACHVSHHWGCKRRSTQLGSRSPVYHSPRREGRGFSSYCSGFPHHSVHSHAHDNFQRLTELLDTHTHTHTGPVHSWGTVVLVVVTVGLDSEGSAMGDCRFCCCCL